MLLTQSTDYWLERLEDARVPCARLNNLAQALADPQVQHRNMVVPMETAGGESFEAPGCAAKFSGFPEESFSSPPELGSDTEQVLRSWTACTPEEVQAARANGVIQ